MNLLAFGYHPVVSIINSPYFSLQKIIVHEKYQKDHKLLTLLSQKKISYQLLNENDFRRASFPKNSQGIVALLNDYQYISLSDLLKTTPQRKHPLFVMLDRIEDPHNFGAILRSSAAFAVDGIIIVDKHQVPINSTVIKVSVGGIAHLPICQVRDLESVVNELKKRDYKIISTTCEKNSTSYQEILKWKKEHPLCLIFGNEHDGIKKSLIKKSDFSLSIPLNNNIPSLNVAASCGIFLALLNLPTLN